MCYDDAINMKEVIRMKVYEKIAALRRSAGLTQEKLGVLLGVSPQAVSKWENDECLPDLALLPDLCAVLHVSADELLDIPPQPVPKGKALVTREKVHIRSQQGMDLAINGAEAVRTVQMADVAPLRDLLSDDAALRVIRALSFTAIAAEEDVAAACDLSLEETRAALFRLLKAEMCQCAPEGYALGANAYLAWAALTAAWLASPEGRDAVGEITVSYAT